MSPPRTAALALAIANAVVVRRHRGACGFSPPLRPRVEPRTAFSSSSSALDLSSAAEIVAPDVEKDVRNERKEDRRPRQEPQPAPEGADEFDWYEAWYPLVPAEILDEEVPHRFELLGMDLVVWKDGSLNASGGEEEESFGPKPKRGKRYKLGKLFGEKRARTGGRWRAFVDECPHRKVPLSEGRVERDGSLLCSYHGWRFDGEGGLVDVPQIDAASGTDKLAIVQNNPKSRCNSFPVRVVDGVLWVWPQTGSDARIESALTDVPNYKPPEDVDPDRIWYGTWNFRELPYGSDFFVENVVDPAHVPVSHHNVVGSRYGDLRQSVEVTKKMTKDGFQIKTYGPSNPIGSTTTFSAPSTVTIEAKIDDGDTDDGKAVQVLELYSSPSRPGFSNHVGRMVVVKPPSGKMPALLRAFALPLPKWVNHVMASSFLNQDALFLHHQERHLAKTGEYTSLNNDPDVDAEPSSNSYVKAVLPVETDRGVLSFREWLARKAGGRIPYRDRPSMPEPDSEVVFDVWNGHTKHCRYCLAALKRLKRARFAAFFAAGCLAAWRPSEGKALSLAGAMASTGMGLMLNKLVGAFYRFEFSHGKND